MSRALTIDATQDHVRAACAQHGAAISVIETLPAGCTRVVLRTADDAAKIERVYKGKVITAPMARTPLSLAARGVPLTEESRPRTAAGNSVIRRY
jgi:hypothetical protein